MIIHSNISPKEGRKHKGILQVTINGVVIEKKRLIDYLFGWFGKKNWYIASKDEFTFRRPPNRDDIVRVIYRTEDQILTS